jgi:hypothetical protein
LMRTLSWFSRASFMKLKISSGIFSCSSNRICFSSSYQLRVKYWTPIPMKLKAPASFCFAITWSLHLKRRSLLFSYACWFCCWSFENSAQGPY